MAARTLADLFGASASLSGGVLSITLGDFSGVGLDNASPDPTDIAAALILYWQSTQATDADTDPTNGLVVNNEFKSFLTRGDSPQIEYQYPVSLYVADTTASLDPDNVV